MPLGDAPNDRLLVGLLVVLPDAVGTGEPLGDAPNVRLPVALPDASGGRAALRTDSMVTPRSVLADTAAASASQSTAVLMPLTVLLLGTSCVMLL